MNLQEFSELKVGDKITNGMTNSVGEVVALVNDGVRVCWGSTGALPFTYTAAMRAWVHWQRAVETAEDGSGVS